MEEALNWSEILFDILFFALLQFCNIGDISRLTQTCKQARKLFNDPSFPPVFQLDTEIDTCEDSKHFTLFAQFAKSSWPQVVRAQLKSKGQPYSDSWEAVVMENTENACFETLLNEENGMQHDNMARGVKDWRIIFLALCTGYELGENFGC